MNTKTKLYTVICRLMLYCTRSLKLSHQYTNEHRNQTNRCLTQTYAVLYLVAQAISAVYPWTLKPSYTLLNAYLCSPCQFTTKTISYAILKWLDLLQLIAKYTHKTAMLTKQPNYSAAAFRNRWFICAMQIWILNLSECKWLILDMRSKAWEGFERNKLSLTKAAWIRVWCKYIQYITAEVSLRDTRYHQAPDRNRVEVWHMVAQEVVFDVM